MNLFLPFALFFCPEGKTIFIFWRMQTFGPCFFWRDFQSDVFFFWLLGTSSLKLLSALPNPQTYTLHLQNESTCQNGFQAHIFHSGLEDTLSSQVSINTSHRLQSYRSIGLDPLRISIGHWWWQPKSQRCHTWVLTLWDVWRTRWDLLFGTVTMDWRNME